MEGIIDFEIVLEPVLRQDHPHAGDDGVQLHNALRVDQLAGLAHALDFQRAPQDEAFFRDAE